MTWIKTLWSFFWPMDIEGRFCYLTVLRLEPESAPFLTRLNVFSWSYFQKKSFSSLVAHWNHSPLLSVLQFHLAFPWAHLAFVCCCVLILFQLGCCCMLFLQGVIQLCNPLFAKEVSLLSSFASVLYWIVSRVTCTGSVCSVCHSCVFVFLASSCTYSSDCRTFWFFWVVSASAFMCRASFLDACVGSPLAFVSEVLASSCNCCLWVLSPLPCMQSLWFILSPAMLCSVVSSCRCTLWISFWCTTCCVWLSPPVAFCLGT